MMKYVHISLSAVVLSVAGVLFLRTFIGKDPAAQMKSWINLLRVGALVCLLPALVSFTLSLSSRNGQPRCGLAGQVVAFLLLVLPLCSLIPEGRMPIKKVLVSLITLAEIVVAGSTYIAFASFGPE